MLPSIKLYITGDQDTAESPERYTGSFVSVKHRLRETEWFPGIDAEVKILVVKYVHCQCSAPHQTYEPPQMSALPENLEMKISSGFGGPYPKGEYLMVAMGEYYSGDNHISFCSNGYVSYWPHILDLWSTSWNKTDKKPPFKGHELTMLATTMDFKHRKISVLNRPDTWKVFVEPNLCHCQWDAPYCSVGFMEVIGLRPNTY